MANVHLGQMATVFLVWQMATFSKWRSATLLLFVNGKWSLKWQMAIHIFMANGHKERFKVLLWLI